MVTGNGSEVQPSGAPSPSPAPRGGHDARWWVLVLVAAAAAALFWPKGETQQASAPGGFVVDAQGRPAKVGDRMAEVTLVHFWATWCPPCVQEIPEIQRFRRDFADRHNFKVVMIAVADDPEKAREFLGGAPDDSLLFDPNWDVAHRYGSSQIPESYLVVDGKVVEKFVGATHWSDPAIRKKITDRL